MSTSCDDLDAPAQSDSHSLHGRRDRAFVTFCFRPSARPRKWRRHASSPLPRAPQNRPGRKPAAGSAAHPHTPQQHPSPSCMSKLRMKDIYVITMQNMKRGALVDRARWSTRPASSRGPTLRIDMHMVGNRHRFTEPSIENTDTNTYI
jgi:hypothetical protein